MASKLQLANLTSEGAEQGTINTSVAVRVDPPRRAHPILDSTRVLVLVMVMFAVTLAYIVRQLARPVGTAGSEL